MEGRVGKNPFSAKTQGKAKRQPQRGGIPEEPSSSKGKRKGGVGKKDNAAIDKKKIIARENLGTR